MRVRTVIRRLVWAAMMGVLGYGAVVVGASFFETRQVVDEAVFEAGRRPRAAVVVGQVTDSMLLEFAVETALAVPLWVDRSFELSP